MDTLRSHPPIRRRLFRALVSLGGGVLALLVLEVGVRWLAPAPLSRFRDAGMDWRLDHELGWVQKQRLDVTSRSERGWWVRFRTNGDGLQPETARRARRGGVVRILLFGDSAVVGRAVPPEETLHAQLEKRLRDAGLSVEVWNAGVQGYSTDQVLLLMRRLLPLYRPDVVSYSLCGNDFGGNASSEAYGIPKPRFALNHGRLELVAPDLARLQSVPIFGGGPKEWLQYSALYRVLQPSLVMLRARFGRWEERNLVGLAPEVYYDRSAAERLDWRLLGALIGEMNRTAEQAGSRLFVYGHPDLAEVWDPYIRDTISRLHLPPGSYDRFALQRRLAALAAAQEVPFCPLIEPFIARERSGPFHCLPRDPHCNPRGYALQAEILAGFLRRQGLLEPARRAAGQTVVPPGAAGPAG